MGTRRHLQFRRCILIFVAKEHMPRGAKKDWNGSLQERFESKYLGEPNSGCWLWTGAIGGRDGRAMIGRDGKVVYAARVAWELYCGEIPEGIQVLHICDVPSCVNPDHLWLGTQDDNMKDCAQKGRIVPNIGKPFPRKLTAAQIEEIRTKELYREEYAAKFGIHPMYVNTLQRGLPRKKKRSFL